MHTNLSANQRTVYRAMLLGLFIVLTIVSSTRMQADTGSCGGANITLPFTDVPASNIFFCSIASAFFSGLTNGTTAMTYSPTQPVPREQMAAFITRTHDSALKRGNRRAAAQQWWTPRDSMSMRPTAIGIGGDKIAWDGADIWVSRNYSDRVTRVRASDGDYLYDVFAGADVDPDFNPHDVLVAAGFVFVTSLQGPSSFGRVYRIKPDFPNDHPEVVEVFANNTGPNPTGITFDGQFFWTANNAGGIIGGSITRISLSGAETTFTAGLTAPSDILWDGENLWVADFAADRVRRVDHNTGAVLQSITVGNAPRDLLFDGANLWVSNFFGDSVTVIRAAGGLRGTVLATLNGNGIDGPAGLAFDGERVLVTNPSGDSVSLFKAVDLTPLGNLSGAGSPPAACSDGLNFWIVSPAGYVMRF